MHAMLLTELGSLSANPAPLHPAELPVPTPAADELLLQVAVCGVCHTELDEIEGRTPPHHLPVIPGHQVIGRVAACGARVKGWKLGERAGAAWIHHACGVCSYCKEGRENLCYTFTATGRDQHGGYAEYMTIPADYSFRIPEVLSDAEAAPLLCAGAVGRRALTLTALRDGQRLGLAGFGASAHLVLQMCRRLYPHSPVYVFTRSAASQAFARELGAAWAGSYSHIPSAALDAFIDTTPAWRPVVTALELLAPGGRLVINARSKEDADKEALLDLDYQVHLWREKSLLSVANVTRADVRACLALAVEAGIRPTVHEYPLAEANQALQTLHAGGLTGALVLRVG